MAVINDNFLIELELKRGVCANNLDHIIGSHKDWINLDQSIKLCMKHAYYGAGEIAHIPQDLIDQLRQIISKDFDMPADEIATLEMAISLLKKEE